MTTQLWAVALVIFGGFFGALAPIFLKKGSDAIKRKNLSTIFLNFNLAAGIIIHILGTIIFITALTGGDLSVLYPIVSLSYVWVCIYSVFLLNEKMNKLKWLGILVVVAGVSLIGIGA
jgi:drug/metabolite transporter (DMT)-like permease